jgi:hypothetical protein
LGTAVVGEGTGADDVEVATTEEATTEEEVDEAGTDEADEVEPVRVYKLRRSLSPHCASISQKPHIERLLGRTK